MDDNSLEIKKNLVQSLHRLRIDAECEVLEIGDMEISNYAYEKTLELRSREEFLRRIEDQNFLNLPVSSLPRQSSAMSGSKQKLNLSYTLFKSFARTSDKDEKEGPYPSAFNPHTNIDVHEISPIDSEPPHTLGTTSNIDKSAEMMNTAVKLNTLIKKNSGEESECRLVVCNLPGPSEEENSLAYVEYLTTLTEGLPRVMLLKGTGSEVITNYI
jgi:hypothetical protein